MGLTLVLCENLRPMLDGTNDIAEDMLRIATAQASGSLGAMREVPQEYLNGVSEFNKFVER